MSDIEKEYKKFQDDTVNKFLSIIKNLPEGMFPAPNKENWDSTGDIDWLYFGENEELHFAIHYGVTQDESIVGTYERPCVKHIECYEIRQCPGGYWDPPDYDYFCFDSVDTIHEAIIQTVARNIREMVNTACMVAEHEEHEKFLKEHPNENN